MPYCSYCGTKNPDDNDFCSKCGSSLTGGTGQLNPDTVLEGRYVIVKTLGRGGMGAVYLALDQRLNNIPVAIKEMSTNAVGHGRLQAAIAAFKKEATMLISLRHPALPRITDFFARGKDRWYLVMDYIEGETLRAVVQRRGPIPQKEVLDWANQLCSILDYLHSQQPPVIFRDLKPANIMLTPDGKIKLIDFGIARHFRPGLTSDTIAYGSSGFAPPEQYGENQTDPRSDIYALGATLHYLLTGIDPGKNPFSFEPPGIFAQVSPGLESAIMRALELKPENRPANIKEMLAVITGENESNTGTSETTSLLPEAGTGTGETLDTLPDLVEEQIETTEMLDEPAQELDEPTELIAEEESENEAEVQPEVTETLYIDNTNQEMNNAPDQTPGEPKAKTAEFPVAQPTIKKKIKWVAAIAGIVIMLSVGWYGVQHLKTGGNNDSGVPEKKIENVLKTNHSASQQALLQVPGDSNQPTNPDEQGAKTAPKTDAQTPVEVEPKKRTQPQLTTDSSKPTSMENASNSNIFSVPSIKAGGICRGGHSGGILVCLIPEGAYWVQLPKANVVSGDLILGTPYLWGDLSVVCFPVVKEMTTEVSEVEFFGGTAYFPNGFPKYEDVHEIVSPNGYV